MKNQNSENKLITAAIRGDADAFCRLYDLYKLRLYRYGRYRLGNDSDAEDAVSECFLSAWKQIGALRDPDAFAGWLFRIMAGCCSRIIDQQIKKRSTISIEGAKATDVLDNLDTGIMLQNALEILSEEDRNIVLLSVVGGFKSREIADITGLRPGSVRSRLSRALAKMRQHLEDE